MTIIYHRLQLPTFRCSHSSPSIRTLMCVRASLHFNTTEIQPQPNVHRPRRNVSVRPTVVSASLLIGLEAYYVLRIIGILGLLKYGSSIIPHPVLILYPCGSLRSGKISIFLLSLQKFCSQRPSLFMATAASVVLKPDKAGSITSTSTGGLSLPIDIANDSVVA